MPPALAHRPASALWVLVAALGALYGALAPSMPFDATGRGTHLARAAFHPDEAILQSGTPTPERQALRVGPEPGALTEAEAERAELKLDLSMRWNGHVERRWTLPDGREFVLTPWGGTWWQAQGQRRRAEVDLPGHDPSLSIERLDGQRLLVEHRAGGYWLIDLTGAQARVESRTLHPDHPGRTG